MTSVDAALFECAVRLDSVGLRRLYPRVRDALLAAAYQLTDTVDVVRVLERLIATSIERDAKRVLVRVQVAGAGTQVSVIDRRRLNPRESLPSVLVRKDLARASGVNLVGQGGGLMLWAIVDRRSSLDGPPAA